MAENAAMHTFPASAALLITLTQIFKILKIRIKIK